MNLPGEVWETVPGWEGYYKVSNFLRVKRVARIVKCGNKGYRITRVNVLKQKVSWTGYWAVYLSKDGKTFEALVHILYGKCSFLPNPENKRCINHKDGNKLNNLNNNLERATHAENNNHARNIGLNRNYSETHNFAKLTNRQAIEIFQSSLSAKFLSSKFNVSRTTITRIKRGQIWNRVTGGIYRKNNPKVLSREVVFEIYDCILPQREIARRFGISQQTVSEIKTGKTWLSVTKHKQLEHGKDN
jgi:hypothetical protein